MNKIDALHKRLLYSLIFAIAFVAVGQGLPYTYYKYYDKHEYVAVDLPVDTDLKVYNPCDKVLISTVLRSEISTTVDGTLQLTMVNAENQALPLKKYSFNNVVIKDGDQSYSVNIPLACEIAEGIYYYEGIFKYQFRGIDKEFYFYTGRFNVTNSPLSPKPGKDGI